MDIRRLASMINPQIARWCGIFIVGIASILALMSIAAIPALAIPADKPGQSVIESPTAGSEMAWEWHGTEVTPNVTYDPNEAARAWPGLDLPSLLPTAGTETAWEWHGTEVTPNVTYDPNEAARAWPGLDLPSLLPTAGTETAWEWHGTEAAPDAAADLGAQAARAQTASNMLTAMARSAAQVAWEWHGTESVIARQPLRNEQPIAPDWTLRS